MLFSSSSFFPEQVTRIMGVEPDSPYDVIGSNRNMSADNIKKK